MAITTATPQENAILDAPVVGSGMAFDVKEVTNNVHQDTITVATTVDACSLEIAVMEPSGMVTVVCLGEAVHQVITTVTTINLAVPA